MWKIRRAADMVFLFPRPDGEPAKPYAPDGRCAFIVLTNANPPLPGMQRGRNFAALLPLN